jgi:hypothetical protein
MDLVKDEEGSISGRSTPSSTAANTFGKASDVDRCQRCNDPVYFAERVRTFLVRGGLAERQIDTSGRRQVAQALSTMRQVLQDARLAFVSWQRQLAVRCQSRLRTKLPFEQILQEVLKRAKRYRFNGAHVEARLVLSKRRLTQSCSFVARLKRCSIVNCCNPTRSYIQICRQA